MNYTLLILSGLGDSAEGHWQNNWLHHFPNAHKVIQNNWDQPLLKDWLETLTTSIHTIQGPILIVAHSLAVSLVAHWSQNNTTDRIVGAVLVAPADVDSREHTPPETWSFAPIPKVPFGFPSVVITSSNDPYITTQKAAFLAKKWGSEFVNVGPKGHLNSASQLGLWEEGQHILNNLVKQIEEKK